MLSFFKKIYLDANALPKGVKLISFVLFLRTLGWGFVDPFFSIFVGDFANNYAGVGGFVSIMNLTALLVMFPLMRLADRMKDTAIMRDGEVAYIFAVIFYLLAGYTGRLPFLIMAFIMNGAGLSLMMVGAETYLRKYASPEAASRSFAFYTALNYLGWIVGMVISAYTVQYYGLKLMFLFIIPSVFMGLWVLRHIPEEGLRSLIWGIRKYFHNRDDLNAIVDDFRALNHKTFFFLLLSFFDGILVMFSYVFIPLFAVSIDLDLKGVALLMAVMYCPFVFSYIITELTEKLQRMHLIASGLIIGAVSFVLLTFIVDSMWIAVLAVMTSVSLSIMRPAYNSMITRLTPRKFMGEVTSLNNLSVRFGYVVGPVLTGIVADRFSLQAAFFFIAVLAFILAFLAIFFRGFEFIKTDL